MKSFLIILVFSLLTNLVHSSTLLEKTYQTEFEILNQEIRHELLHGDLTSRSVKQSLKARIKTLGSIALQIGGVEIDVWLFLAIRKLSLLSRLWMRLTELHLI